MCRDPFIVAVFTLSTFLTIGLNAPAARGQAPQQKSVLVSPEVQADGKITFRLRAPKAEKVSVICDAVGTQPMTKDADGIWSVTVGPVAPGIYDCQFDVDGLRITDPMDFFEELTGHHILDGLFPYELLKSASELDALASAHVAWLVVNEPGQTRIMENRLVVPKEPERD